MSIKNFLDCDKVGQVCDKCQYDESSASERLILRIHNFYCNQCREHSQKNTRLSQLLKKSDLEVMPEEKKQQLLRLIEQELNNQAGSTANKK